MPEAVSRTVWARPTGHVGTDRTIGTELRAGRLFLPIPPGRCGFEDQLPVPFAPASAVSHRSSATPIRSLTRDESALPVFGFQEEDALLGWSGGHGKRWG